MGKRDNSKKRAQRLQIIRQGCMAVAAAAAMLGACGSVDAFEIKTGNEDVLINWDNTLRYTLAQRLKGQSKDIVNSANNNDGDRNFNVGLVSSRLDLLTEADVVYKKDYGVRLSGAAWYDPIYRDKLDGSNNPTSNHFTNGIPSPGLNSYTRDRFGGVDAELLDAFAFAKFNFGDVPLTVRAGRHTIYWGEAFFPAAGANSISYGQSPLDLAKALAMPGVELKEIFRPLNQVSFQVQPNKELTIAGQYYLQWESNIFPEGGSYLGMVDALLNSGESAYLPYGPIKNAGDRTPKQARDWGLKVAYSPEALNATFGFYYRNYSDKMPQVVADIGAYPGVPVNVPTNFHFDYKSNIDLYGISFAKNILGVSVGSEMSYRRNTPLSSQWLMPEGARGDTMHAVLNFLALLPKTPVFDSGSAILEFAYGRLDRVTTHPEAFTGFGGANGVGLDHATRDNSTVTVNLVPEWKQVLPGVDLAMPLNFSMGMHGNSAVALGGAKDSGSYSVGLSCDLYAKYKLDLTYASFFGLVHPDANGQVAPPGNAASGQGAGDPIALLRDRDLLSMTLKASF